MKNQGIKKVRKKILYTLLLSLFLMCAGCGKEQQMPVPTSTPAPQEEEQPEIIYRPGSYDSLDTAVIVSKNDEEKTVTLLSTAVGKKYTLKVEGTSTLYDRHGSAVSLGQMKEGDIVEVTFLKDIKRLNSMQLYPQSWANASVGRYEIDWKTNSITIGKDQYKFSENTLFLSQGKEIEQMDLSTVDVLTFQGIGSNVLSVVVEKGHGYLRLENDSKFIGGFIEVGQSMITLIKEDMLLTVPEGTYQVLFSVEGGDGVKNVTIARNQEVTLDIGDLEVEDTKYGTVIFSMSPAEATLYIDGEKVDTSVPITLEYGIHQIIAKADGYSTLTNYLKVGQVTAGIDIQLDKVQVVQEKEDPSTTYKVFIDAPTDVEVYVDGNYVGISPVSFAKDPGTHNLTLRKEGYETRSYTIVVDEEDKDISFSFGDLVANPTLSLDSILFQ